MSDLAVRDFVRYGARWSLTDVATASTYMGDRLSSRPDAATMVGVSLLVVAGVALICDVFRITDVLVTATCGAEPSRNYAAIDGYIAFLHCQGTTEQRYWTVIAVLTGCVVGYAARAWLRREAKQDAKNDQKLDEEMARIRTDTGQRPRA